MDRLNNMLNYRNEKTLPNTFLTIPDCPSHIDRSQESWCLGDFNQDSIPPQHIELDQSQTLDKLASFHFKKIELEYEYDPDPQLCDSILIFDSMLTLVSLPNLDPILEPTLIHVPIELKIEPPILDSHIPLMGKECEF